VPPYLGDYRLRLSNVSPFAPGTRSRRRPAGHPQYGAGPCNLSSRFSKPSQSGADSRTFQNPPRTVRR